MARLPRWAQRLLSDRGGATTVEYGLVLALICVVALGVITQVAGKTIDMWNLVSGKVVNAG